MQLCHSSGPHLIHFMSCNKSAIGPSGVRALPLAAGINEGGHYFRYFQATEIIDLVAS